MIGKRIKEYLVERGIKQVYVADKTGIPPQIISAMLNESRNIDAVEYYKICSALNIPMNFLFDSNTDSEKAKVLLSE